MKLFDNTTFHNCLGRLGRVSFCFSTLAHFFLRKKPVGWRPGDSIGQMLLHNPSQCQLLHDRDDTLSEGGLREQPLGFHGKHQPSNQICHVGHLEPLPDNQDSSNNPPSGVHPGSANHSHVPWSCLPLHRKHCTGFTVELFPIIQEWNYVLVSLFLYLYPWLRLKILARMLFCDILVLFCRILGGGRFTYFFVEFERFLYFFVEFWEIVGQGAILGDLGICLVKFYFLDEVCRDRRLQDFAKILAWSLFSFTCLSQNLSTTPAIIFSHRAQSV